MIAILALTGLLLIFLEFFLPGAIMAIGGTLMLLASLLLFYFQVDELLYFAAYALVLGVALFITIRLAIKRIKKGKVLHTSDQEGFLACAYPKEMIGKSAIVTADLKPSGYIEIDGNAFAALSKMGYIEKGMYVRIIGGQGAHLIVSEEKIHDSTPGASH
jgi:membrane-bound ClpP family serine protease